MTKTMPEMTMHAHAALERRLSPSSVNSLSSRPSSVGWGIAVSSDCIIDFKERPALVGSKIPNEEDLAYKVHFRFCRVDYCLFGSRRDEEKKLPRSSRPVVTFFSFAAAFKMADYFGLTYGALVLTGGLIGYLKAGSIPSLVAGVVSGLLAGYGAYTENNALLLGVSGVLGGIMGKRFLNSGKLMPAGIICVLSLAIFGRGIIRAIQASR
uniref:Transmembrane protein 14C n=1 Tax=Steinernema glaseri TaxID=37863 RepID=A0A1I7XZM7_9BILA